MNIFDLTAHELKELFVSKKISSKDLISSTIQRAQHLNVQTNAFVRFFDNTQAIQALKQEDFVLPIAFKDNICIQDQEMTAASAMLKGFVAPYDAFVTQKIKQNHLMILGSLNMDDFALGSSTETSVYGGVKNPWDLNRVAGGSSGGSAAAVASGQILWALGSDTGGSIRQPASFCGVVGLKPTYGRVSRYGLMAVASSFDQIGPLAKDVRDAAELFSMIAGFDSQDPTSLDVPALDMNEVFLKDVQGLRIGIPKEYFLDNLQPEIKIALDDAILFFENQGAIIKEVSLPHIESATATYFVLSTAEMSSNFSRFDGVRYGQRAMPSQQRKASWIDMYEETRAQGFSDEVKRRIILGTYFLSSEQYQEYYLRAQKVRTLIREDFQKAFEHCDILMTPTTPTTAFSFGKKSKDPLAMSLSDKLTLPANLVGIPALTIPCGFDQQHLPMGLQLMANHFNEKTIFQAAYCYEQAHTWHQQRAKL